MISLPSRGLIWAGTGINDMEKLAGAGLECVDIVVNMRLHSSRAPLYKFIAVSGVFVAGIPFVAPNDTSDYSSAYKHIAEEMEPMSGCCYD